MQLFLYLKKTPLIHIVIAHCNNIFVYTYMLGSLSVAFNTQADNNVQHKQMKYLLEVITLLLFELKLMNSCLFV